MSESSDENRTVSISDEQLPEDLQPDDEDTLSDEEKPEDPLPEG